MRWTDEAFAVVYAAHYPAIVRFAEGMLAGGADAHDLAQETFVRLHRAGDGLPRDHVRFWLIRVARNLAINELRRRATLRRLHLLLPWIDPPPDPHEIAAGREERSRVRALLRELPPNLRAPLLLREWELLPYADIARALGATESKIKSDLFRARRRLRAALEKSR